jgi:hypothetical protein
MAHNRTPASFHHRSSTIEQADVDIHGNEKIDVGVKSVTINEFGDHVFIPASKPNKFETQMTKRKDKYLREIPQGYVVTQHMDDQWRWHAAFRDSSYHMYRTSYQDQIQGREVCCQRTAPSGYGGYQARIKHDVLFDMTAFDEHQDELRNDPERVKLPDFTLQMKGLPSFTPNPEGMRPVPTSKTILRAPQDYVESPWGTTGKNAFAVLSNRMNAKPLPPRPYEMTNDSLDTLQSTVPLLPKDLVETTRAPVKAGEGEESADVQEPRRRQVALDLTPRDYSRRLATQTTRGLATTGEVLASSLVDPIPRPDVCIAPELQLPKGSGSPLHKLAQSRAASILQAAPLTAR